MNRTEKAAVLVNETPLSADMVSEDIQMIDRLSEQLLSATILDITWERVIMKLTVRIATADNFNDAIPLDFYLVSDRYRANGQFQIDSIHENVYSLSINITNPGYCRCLTPATYSIRICQGNDIIGVPSPTVELAESLSTKSKMFLHGNLRMGYSVEFFVSEKVEFFELAIVTQDMNRKPIDSWRKEKTNARARKKHFRAIKKWLRSFQSRSTKHRVIRKAYTHYLKKNAGKTDKRVVMFMSEQNDSIGNNLACVRDRMIQRGLDKEFEIIESARNIVGKGGYGIRNWLHLMNMVSRADILFVDDHVPFLDWLILDKKTTLIQLWHAGAGYKSVGYSRWGRKGSPRAFCAHRQYDYGITPSKNIAFFFSEQFGINDEQILPTGIPRMDSYIDPTHAEETKKELLQKFPLIHGKKVILFAPTYRGINRREAYYPYELIDFDRLYDFCGDEYVVLFKMHPWVQEEVPIDEEKRNRFIDMNSYPNINDLFYITDILITDYSSSVFEFSLMRKPMLFFAFDEYQYMYSRGFHRDYRPACPGKICSTFDEVLDALKHKDYEDYKLDDYIRYHYDRVDSQASDRVIDWFILDKIPEEYLSSMERRKQNNERLKALNFDVWSDLEAVEE